MLPLFVKMSQAPGSWSAVWFLPPLVLAVSPLHHWEVQSHSCIDAEFHVVQRSTLGPFTGREPKCVSHLLPGGRGVHQSQPGGSLRVTASASGCFQLACLFLNAWFPTRATFISRLGASSSRGILLSSMDRPIRLNLPRASLAASKSPSVSIARTPVYLPRLERLPGIAPGRPSVSGGVPMWRRTRQDSWANAFS